MKNDEANALDYRHFGAFRLLLAMLVMLQHYIAHLAPRDVAAAARPVEIGSMAVLAFFCLSGFVIAEAADRVYRGRPAAFIANRFLRIAPHFALAALLTGAVYFLFTQFGVLQIASDEIDLSDDAFGLRNLIANLFGFLPLGDRFIRDNFLVIGWAIRVEMAFYAVVLLWIALTQILAARSFKLGFGAVGGMLALALLPPFLFVDSAPDTLQYLPHFVFGCALYCAASHRHPVAIAVCMVSAVAISQQILGRPADAARNTPAEFALLAGLLAIMVCAAFATISGGRKIDRILGDLTYPLYLYHHLIMVIALSLFAPSSWITFGGAMIASLMFAAAMQALVDPAINRLRDRLRGRRMSDDGVETAPRATVQTTATAA